MEKKMCLICGVFPEKAKSVYCYKDLNKKLLVDKKEFKEEPLHIWVEGKIINRWFDKGVLNGKDDD